MEKQLNTLARHPILPYEYLNSYIDFIAVIGKKATDLCVGEGVIFDSEDDKIQEFLDEWAEKQNLWLKLQKFVYINSTIGNASLWLAQNKEGEWDLILGEVLSNIRVSRFNENIVAAEIFTAKNSGDKGHYFKFNFTKDKISIKKWISDDKTRIGTLETEVPPSAQLVENTTLNSGWEKLPYLPIIQTYNLPKPNFYPNNTLIFIPDWAPVINYMIEPNAAIYEKRRERELNHTYLNGYFSPEFMQAIMAENNDLAKALKNGLLQSKGANYSTNGTNEMQITYGNPQLANYNDDYLHSSVELWNACGYNHPREAENKNYQNRTATLMMGILDEQTTRVKQRYYSNEVYKLITDLLILVNLWDGKGSRPYKMKWLSLGLADMVVKNELLMSQYQAGIISPIDYIQEMFNVNQRTAEQKFAEAQAYQKVMFDNQLNQEQEANDESNKSTEKITGDISKDVEVRK